MTEEMEKNFKDLEELYKLGMLDAEGYAFQKKQLEDEMARESGQAASAPIQQETASPSLEAPPPLPEMPKIHVSVGGKEIGAFEREEVIQKIRVGEIRRDARVWIKGMDGWVDAGTLPDLEVHFGPPPDTTVTVSAEDAQTLTKKGNDAYDRKNYAEAFWCWNKAAEQGYADAQNKLGVSYLNGAGVAKDKAKAFELFRKAVDQGHIKAQYNLALSYDNGEGVSQDKAKAVYWYTKAAEQGDADAQYNLGVCYNNGEGVPRDYAKADYWVTKAAEQGNRAAKGIKAEGINKNELSTIVYKGRDEFGKMKFELSQPRRSAYLWFKEGAQR